MISDFVWNSLCLDGEEGEEDVSDDVEDDKDEDEGRPGGLRGGTCEVGHLGTKVSRKKNCNLNGVQNSVNKSRNRTPVSSGLHSWS